MREWMCDLKDTLDVVSRCMLVNGRLGVFAHEVVDGRHDIQHLVLRHDAVAVRVVQTERPQQLLMKVAT